ncbi:MAG TPA: hypothetical protein VII08_06905 [Myxococcales bacterium]
MVVVVDVVVCVDGDGDGDVAVDDRACRVCLVHSGVDDGAHGHVDVGVTSASTYQGYA